MITETVPFKQNQTIEASRSVGKLFNAHNLCGTNKNLKC